MDSIYRVVFDEYIADLHRQGRRPRGINNVSCRLKRFFDYLSEQELTFARVRVNEAQGYQGWLKEYGSRTGVAYRNASIKTVSHGRGQFLRLSETDRPGLRKPLPGNPAGTA
jgi:hypothetical protein